MRTALHPHRRRPGRWALSILLTGCLLAVTHHASAQDAPDEEEVDEDDQAAQHFAKGRSLYGEGKYKEAIEELLKAFELRPAPPILLNIGRTYEKLDNKVKALEFYRKYLVKARIVDPNRPRVEALVKQLERETGSKVSSDASADTPTAASTSEQGGSLRQRIAGMIHTPVDAAKVREPIIVQAELPPGVDADAVWLRYRRQGERDFRKLAMAPQGDAFVGRIPGGHVTTTSLQYYVEATKKGKKKAVATAGDRRNPNIVVIEGGRAVIAGQAPGEVEIVSPYRTWLWVSAGGTVALIGGTVAMALLANDRASAVEVAADPTQPREPFDRRARDWESQGKTFATIGKLFFGLGIAAAGATGYLWYLDHKYIKQERRKLAQGGSMNVVRFSGGPWASGTGAGFIGRIDF